MSRLSATNFVFGNAGGSNLITSVNNDGNHSWHMVEGNRNLCMYKNGTFAFYRNDLQTWVGYDQSNRCTFNSWESVSVDFRCTAAYCDQPRCSGGG